MGVSFASAFRRPSAAAMTAAALLPILACASHRVLVPPRLDLAPYGSVGLVTFAVENATGTLQDAATRRFEEQVLSAQSGLEVLELGPADSVLHRLGVAALGPAAAESIGAHHPVAAVFFGHLRVSNVQPSGGLFGRTFAHVDATVSAELTVELVSTKTGGTVWRSSAVASEKVGGVSLSGGIPSFSARDPNQTYARLVNRLVATVTRDLWRPGRSSEPSPRSSPTDRPPGRGAWTHRPAPGLRLDGGPMMLLRRP